MRMHMRRFTRFSNAFSKKIENHTYQVALHSMFYNFVRIHQTLKVTPAMAAGVTTRLWEMEDMVKVIEAWEAEQAVAGITYEAEANRIGEGFFVRITPRYGQPETVHGFATLADAHGYIEKRKAAHGPGRRRKLASGQS
jgi:hypothetical protein